jgi:hypothetical protein
MCQSECESVEISSVRTYFSPVCLNQHEQCAFLFLPCKAPAVRVLLSFLPRYIVSNCLWLNSCGKYLTPKSFCMFACVYVHLQKHPCYSLMPRKWLRGLLLCMAACSISKPGIGAGKLSKRGLLLNNGTHKLTMLAPPVDARNEYADIVSKQRGNAKKMGLEGLISHMPGSSTTLSPPLPTIDILIEPESDAPLPIAKLRKNVAQVRVALGNQSNRRKIGCACSSSPKREITFDLVCALLKPSGLLM